ncbi:MAG: hypothetical protein II220_08385 [Spirochaetales bacterium]|nr:hypothetical protein [Spirochaetales bacterium]
MKRYVSLLSLFLVCAILFIGCTENENTDNSSVDQSNYSFVDISWTREAAHDIETIRFGEDGSFSYSCACGNPVNDSDLCEGYTYDDATKTITLDCIEITDDMVTVIKIVKCDEKELHLDFNGETRIFTK